MAPSTVVTVRGLPGTVVKVAWASRFAFEKFVALLPEDGFLAACARYESVLRIADAARARVETYALDHRGADWQARDLALGADGARFALVRKKKGR